MPDVVAWEGQLGKTSQIQKRKKFYPVLVEVLLDFEAAHPAVPLCHAAAQEGECQQQQTGQSSPGVGHPIPTATARDKEQHQQWAPSDTRGRERGCPDRSPGHCAAFPDAGKVPSAPQPTPAGSLTVSASPCSLSRPVCWGQWPGHPDRECFM